MPSDGPMLLIWVWPLAGASNETASVAIDPFGPRAVALTDVPRPETSVNDRFVRKFRPSNAPENETGKRGPAAEKTSIPFMVKPYVPFAVLLYVRLVTLTPRPASGVTYSAPVLLGHRKSV